MTNPVPALTGDGMDLLFEKSQLIPCIVQSALTKEVLMLAYMNAEAYQLTISTQILTFFSRSRKALWIKGETSGNRLELITLTWDCDQDTLLAQVIPSGPVCHTGSIHCFTDQSLISSPDSSSILDLLYERILQRKKEPLQGSYTNYLFQSGLDKILKKIGEENSEVIIAAKNNSERELLDELSDLTYHLWVLLAHLDIKPQMLYQTLKSRFR